MYTQHATIIETSLGFLWAERGAYYKTLAGARRAVLREARRIARSPAAGGRVATVLEVW